MIKMLTILRRSNLIIQKHCNRNHGLINILTKVTFSANQINQHTSILQNNILAQSTEDDTSKNQSYLSVQKREYQTMNKDRTIQTKEVAEKSVSSHENLDNETQRIEFHLFQEQYLPKFIKKYVETSTIISKIKDFNPYLANGGQNFEQFPLIKLLTIAMKHITQDTIKVQTFKKLQYFIKTRLHNCTIEQNMKILYIMLKAFPHYRFNFNFIFSICLALKRQFPLMNDQELKTIFYIISTNKNEINKYNHPLLMDLQQLILMRVLQRFERTNKMEQEGKNNNNLKIENMYEWIYYSLGVGLRNDYTKLVFQTKGKELLRSYNKRCEILATKEDIYRKKHPEHTLAMLEFINLLDKIVRYTKNPKIASINKIGKEIITLKQEFMKAKSNFLTKEIKILQNNLKKGPLQNRLKIFRIMIEDIDINLCQNLFVSLVSNEENIQKDDKDSSKYGAINVLFHELMKEITENEQILIQKMKILVILLDKRVIQSHIAKTYLETFSIPSTYKGLDIVYNLIKLELYIYTFSSQFQPRPQSNTLILNALKNESKIYREFDWLAFNYLFLLMGGKSVKKDINMIGSNMLSIVQEIPIDSNEQVIHLLKKLTAEIKSLKVNKIIQEERQYIKENREIKELQKFFIQIKIHQMKFLQTILEPFYRIPHFSNLKDKIAVNSCDDENIQSASVLLQKKLMNNLGWKVINLNTKKFSNLTINQKLKIIQKCLLTEQQIIRSKLNEKTHAFLEKLKQQQQ